MRGEREVLLPWEEAGVERGWDVSGACGGRGIAGLQVPGMRELSFDEEADARMNKWYQNNREKGIARATQWRREHPEASKRYVKNWQDRNRVALNARRRARRQERWEDDPVGARAALERQERHRQEWKTSGGGMAVIRRYQENYKQSAHYAKRLISGQSPGVPLEAIPQEFVEAKRLLLQLKRAAKKSETEGAKT